MDHMSCARPGCGHSAWQHDDTGCRVKVLTGWDDSARSFAGQHGCGCDAYVERGSRGCPKTGCPHELVKDNPRCVHCGVFVGSPAM